MRIALVTNCIYDNEPEFVKYTDDYKRQYCQKYGIDYIRTDINPLPDLHPVWCKLPILISCLKIYNWTIWMDADATTVGMNVDVPSYLATVNDKVVMQQDILGWNAGVFAVSSGKRTLEWLNHVYEMRTIPKYDTGFREQQAMSDTFDSEWKDIVVEPPKVLGWNQYFQDLTISRIPNPYHDEHWCLHLPGYANYIRNCVFKDRLWIR